jgi:DNA polymerase elongation subunit (family B)
MRGWIFDTYPDYRKDHMVSWIRTEDGVEKLVDRKFFPTFYVHGSRKNLKNLADMVSAHKLRDLSFQRQKIKLGYDGRFEVLAVTPYRYKDVKLLAKMIDAQGGYRDFELYNIDIRLAQRYLVERGIFPMAYVDVGREFILLDEQMAMEYPLPKLTHTEIGVKVGSDNKIKKFNDPLQAIKVGNHVFKDDDEIDLLRGMVREIRNADPDIIYMKNGDSFLLPYLYNRAKANGILDEIQLGREEQSSRPERSGRSYFRYGRVEYKPPLYTLRGRLHIDTGNSFLHMESGLKGLIELSRLSCIPIQTLAKLSPGTAISAMQVNQAMKNGHPVMWKKNLPEDFKTAKELMVTDRGGFIYEPVVGIHDRVLELDYTSLYPSIMVRFNISPETLKCSCCPDSKIKVPEIGYNICEKQVGLVAKVLKPVIQRRMVYKKRGKEGDLEYKERSDILKWLLVTCLDGETLVPFEQDGELRIEPIAKIVDRYLPEGEGVQEISDRLQAFGLTKKLESTKAPVKEVFKFKSPNKVLRLRLKPGRDLWVTKDHPCYVLKDGELKVKRADELKKGDCIPIMAKLDHGETNNPSIDLLNALETGLPQDELPLWRAFGPDFYEDISRSYDSIKASASDEYAQKSVWNWREYGYLPFQFLSDLQVIDGHPSVETIGRGRRGGGEVQEISAQIDVDFDLGFLLGYFVGDGNAKAGMVRFAINAEDGEVIEMLRRIIQEKFGLPSSLRKERHANMYVLQANSIALRRAIEVGLGVPKSTADGKLDIPSFVLNGSSDVKFGFLSGLIASDGCVSKGKNFIDIATHSLTFAKKIGLLLSMVGLEYRLVFGERLHNVQLRGLRQLQMIFQNGWLKSKHRKRVEEKLRIDCSPRENQIPIVESNLLRLSKKARATREPRVTNKQFVSREDALQKFEQLIDKQNRFDQQDFEDLERLKTLLHSSLTFSRIVSIEEVSPRTPFVYCFGVDQGLPGFVVEGNVFTHNCFGYTGYKNARYGRIECHESITAYGREIMLRSAEIAERHGYKVLHGIVDSLWLEGNGSPKAVAEHMRNDIGIPIEIEGVYKWIVFLPCKSMDVGAMNRYYGLFENGEMKIRGIETRRRDTPELVKKAQYEMLDILSKAENSHEFKETIPEALGALKVWAERVVYGDVDLEDLIFTSRVSKSLEEYAHFSNQVAALTQLEEHMVDVNPGEIVRYMLVNSESMKASKRLKIADLVEDGDEYDKKKYVEHLFKAGESLFQSFGYDLERIENEYGV